VLEANIDRQTQASDNFKRGLAAARVGDRAEARRFFGAATRQNPNDGQAWLELAGVVDSLEEKREYLSRALSLDPSLVEAQAALTRVEQKLGLPASHLVDAPLITGVGSPYCSRHPEVETGLHCNRCGKPICPKCAQPSLVGFRCPDCVMEIENRYYRQVKAGQLSPYERPLAKPFFTYVLLGLIVVIWVGMELAGGSTNGEVLLRFGANYGPLIIQGDLWRLFTSMFLHIGGQHLAFNSVGLIAFGFEMERIYGRLRYLVIYLLAGLFGNLASFALKGPLHYSAGASGAIFGLIGMNLAFFFYYRYRTGEYGRQRRNMVFVLILVSLVLGYSVMPADNVAHMGGALAGFALGYLLAPRYQVVIAAKTQRKIVDRGSLLKRWWALILSIALLAGGVWSADCYWSSVWDAMLADADLSINEGEIAYGQTVTGELRIETFGDYWAFEGQAGDAVTITISGDTFLGYIELLGPNYEFLKGGEVMAPVQEAVVDQHVLSASGRYIIFVATTDQTPASYELTLMRRE
jgi:membrane associated rhomboid family serine protease